jgi:hypothetical protein
MPHRFLHHRNKAIRDEKGGRSGWAVRHVRHVHFALKKWVARVVVTRQRNTQTIVERWVAMRIALLRKWKQHISNEQMRDHEAESELGDSSALVANFRWFNG